MTEDDRLLAALERELCGEALREQQETAQLASLSRELALLQQEQQQAAAAYVRDQQRKGYTGC